MSRTWRVACSLLTALACTPAADSAFADGERTAEEVRLRLARYATAAGAVDAAISASFFAPRGTLFEPGIPPIVGPDSIRAFIESFPGVEVDSAMLRADTVEVFGHTALVWGTYFERLRFPGQPASAQHGRFVMEWRRDAAGVWMIERYYRVPLPAGWRDKG
ncbi:MAG: YybH family protein [Gemmatimonadaceae bacterium]